LIFFFKALSSQNLYLKKTHKENKKKQLKRALTNNLRALLERLGKIIDHKHLERPLIIDNRVLIQPLLSILGQPRPPQKHLNERDHLECLAQTHGMRQNAPEARAPYSNATQRLNNIVVHEANAADLVCLGTPRQIRQQTNVRVLGRVTHIDEHAPMDVSAIQLVVHVNAAGHALGLGLVLLQPLRLAQNETVVLLVVYDLHHFTVVQLDVRSVALARVNGAQRWVGAIQKNKKKEFN